MTTPGPARAIFTSKVPENLAVIERAASTVTTHVTTANASQAPLHPTKVAPGPGNAVSATAVSVGKVAAHKSPQESPIGSLATRPGPDREIVSGYDDAPNRASTEAAALRLTTQVVAAPVHAPDQPRNTEPVSGVALNETVVPPGRFVMHVVAQVMPPPPLTAPGPESVSASA
ncbi:MAG TPA: hypothetical protein VGR87_05795 [Candidatus Limnocylindria bacterium]|nr:hypothetical protein [Candidatus Limnocylindria bacterium]